MTTHRAARAAVGTPSALEVADRVWLATAEIDDIPGGTHHQDLARTDGMAGWRAREFLAGRALLRALLAQVLPADADAAVVPDPRGKPWLDGHGDTGISVSHDGDSVAAAVAVGRPVGVDLQHPDGGAESARARRCLRGSFAQLARLAAAEAAMELAWVWTVQEACVKATGQGIAGRPWAIDVPLGARTGTWREHRWLSLRDRSATPLSCAFGVRNSLGPGERR
jgi:4'-phosphopantetheinyl transferase